MSSDAIVSLGLDLQKGENVMPSASQTATYIAQRLQQLQAGVVPPVAPIDARINEYLRGLLGSSAPGLPRQTFVLTHFGLSRTLSLPPTRDEYLSDIISSYRTRQGVLHNPKNDRRTTKGVFHVAEGGLPIPADKKSVPVATFGALLQAALTPPAQLMELPYTADQSEKIGSWVSLYLRPLVSPAVAGIVQQKTMETRFLAPGNLVSNLDFVESVFGNAGDATLNDAALDIEHWSGHTGCIILAPHLTTLTKKSLGLPHISTATPRQKRDGMCYEKDTELYNDGQAFKITSRDEKGIIVTIIADNYFGYCKKEVKTQISYAANLFGNCEEEHAGGALTFAAYDLGEDFSMSEVVNSGSESYSYREALSLLGAGARPQPPGYAIDTTYDNIYYIPQDARLRLFDQSITWSDEKGASQSLRITPSTTYILPSGYKIEMIRPSEGQRWRLIGTVAEPIYAHKPCTVSGGGKSEISKPIADACITGSIFVMDFQADMDQVEMLLNFDYSSIYQDPARRDQPPLPILHMDLTLGSVVKRFTPSADYTSDYNDFLRSIPPNVIELVLIVKRYYKPDWGNDWRRRFSVDMINGMPGHELKYRNQKVKGTYLRVGYQQDGSWRTLGVRKDFYPAYKIQMEDDITASVVLPRGLFAGLGPNDIGESLKFTGNCEYRLFQRPDDAIVRGYDKQTERDMTRPGNFISNYQPLTRADVKSMVDDAIRFDYFTAPMQDFLRGHAASTQGPEYAACPANPRIVEGQPSKNTRYLQNRLDLLNPRGRYLSQVGLRLARKLTAEQPVHTPVTLVVPGRRNNPPEKGARALCAFNPIHYMELPELFMEYISSMTGKSPSTTGAGSEGALTKGPFNALLPIHDLNMAFVSTVLTHSPTFVSSAAYVGPHFKVDHDISLLIPEVFSRMSLLERNPAYLIQNGYLERCHDYTHNGELIEASRLGWRMTAQFERMFFGRVFNTPGVVLTPEMLRPELQDKEIYTESIRVILQTHRSAAQLYFDDGSIEFAVPPLRALLTLMAQGSYNGLQLTSPQFRALFQRENIISSDWYTQRLQAKQKVDIALWQRHQRSLQAAIAQGSSPELSQRLAYAQAQLQQAQHPSYLASLRGTLGVDPAFRA